MRLEVLKFSRFTFKNPINKTIENIVTQFMPIKTYRDKISLKNFYAHRLSMNYTKKNILAFGSFASDVLFKISPPIEIDHKDLEIFEQCLVKVLELGVVKLISNFLKYKFLKK